MPLFAHLVRGPLAGLHGSGESSVQHANAANAGMESPAQDVLDAGQQFAAEVTGQVGDAVATWATVHREVIPEFVLEASEDITAFVDKYVPIPWLHGGEPMALHG